MCCEIFKTKRNLNAGYMKDLLADRPSKYPNRREDDLYVPKANQYTFGYNSYRVEGPKQWNKLSENTRRANTLVKFKELIKLESVPSCSCQKGKEK